MQATQVPSLSRKIPWSRKWQPTPVSLPGTSHGQRSQESCSPWAHKESDSTDRTHCMHMYIVLGPCETFTLKFFTLHFSSLKSHYLFHCLLVSCLSPFLALSVYNCKYLYVEWADAFPYSDKWKKNNWGCELFSPVRDSDWTASFYWPQLFIFYQGLQSCAIQYLKTIVYIYIHTHTQYVYICVYIYIYYTYYTYTYYMYIYSCCCWRQKKVSLVPISPSWWELIVHVWFLWLQMFVLCMDFYKWRASYLKAIHADHCVLCPFVSRFWISKSLCCHLGTPCLIIEILWIHI